MKRATGVVVVSSAFACLACAPDPTRAWIGLYLGSYESENADCSGAPLGTSSLAGYEVEILDGPDGLVVDGFPCPLALAVEDEMAADVALTECEAPLAGGASAHYTIQPARLVRSGEALEFVLEWEAMTEADCQRGVATYSGLRGPR